VILEVVTQKKVAYTGEVTSVVLPADLGEMGLLAGHADYIVMLKKGVVRASGRDGERRLLVDGGFAEVSHDRITVLADAAAEAPGA
jgi:F-type H+-transporting ATPase subunit epsilon